MEAVLEACLAGRVDEAVELLDGGADVETRGDWLRVPPKYPCVSGTPLLAAAEAASVPLVRILLERGADLEACSSNMHHNPLHWACANSSLEMTELFLDRGANIEARDVEGSPPLHFVVETCSEGHVAVLQLLLDRGAQINSKDDTGRTALHWASRRSAAAVAVLLDRGADIEARTAQGRTALATAAMELQPEIVSVLLARNADMNTQDLWGVTPLMHAAAIGSLEMITMIASRGAQLDLVNANGGTALELAAMWDELEACLLLVREYGAELPEQLPAVYGAMFALNDPDHPPDEDDPDHDDWRPRLTDAELADRVAQLTAARDAYLLQKKRDDNWERRKALLCTLVGSGLRLTAAQQAEQAAVQAALDTSAPIPGDVRDAEWLKRHVLSSEGFVRRIASFV